MIKVYLYAIPTGLKDDVCAVAMKADGEALIQMHFVNLDAAKNQLLNDEKYKKIYERWCKDGFQLEWIEAEDLDTHVGFLEAFELNKSYVDEGAEDG